MKPPGLPSLEWGETHQITPWKITQIVLQDNKHTTGSRYSKIETRSKYAKRRPKLGEKKANY